VVFKNLGTILKKNTRAKVWWMKLGVCLILSNIFFFLLFSGEKENAAAEEIRPGWVELQIKADLLTPYQSGKRILLVNRASRSKAEGFLKGNLSELDGRMTILIHESDASMLFKYSNWEILPFMKTLSFAPVMKGESYEIRY
jgi:hypothetical protein